MDKFMDPEWELKDILFKELIILKLISPDKVFPFMLPKFPFPIMSPEEEASLVSVDVSTLLKFIFPLELFKPK